MVSFMSGVRIWLLVTLFIFLLIFPWQITGLWRAAVRHIKGRKSLLSAWFAIVFAAVKIFLILLFMHKAELWSGTLDRFYLVGNPYQEEEYYVNLSQVYENTIHINGSLTTGVSRAFSSLLDKNPQVKTVILYSPGGLTSEGRKLYKIIDDNKLNTYVLKKCKSACTVAFIAGKERHISPKAELGFHQPSNPYLIERETSKQKLLRHIRKDKILFGQKGVNEEFINKVNQFKSSDMWNPSHQELLEYGVIHEVIDK